MVTSKSYNSATFEDTCTLFAPNWGFSESAHRNRMVSFKFTPQWPLLSLPLLTGYRVDGQTDRQIDKRTNGHYWKQYTVAGRLVITVDSDATETLSECCVTMMCGIWARLWSYRHVSECRAPSRSDSDESAWWRPRQSRSATNQPTHYTPDIGLLLLNWIRPQQQQLYRR